MISAQELRARQASRVQTEKEEFSARFKKATDAYYETIMNEVKQALEAVQDSSYTYIILNFKPLTVDFEGLKYTTMLYGYWNKEKDCFDDSIFGEQGVEKPFERAKKELEALGYRLENVSDPKVSKKLFIKFSWGEEERPRRPVVRRPREKSVTRDRSVVRGDRSKEERRPRDTKTRDDDKTERRGRPEKTVRIKDEKKYRSEDED